MPTCHCTLLISASRENEEKCKCITRRITLYSRKKRTLDRERIGSWRRWKRIKFASKVVNDMVNIIMIWTMIYNSKPKHRYEFFN